MRHAPTYALEVERKTQTVAGGLQKDMCDRATSYARTLDGSARSAAPGSFARWVKWRSACLELGR